MELKIYSILGAEIGTLVKRELNKGPHTIEFDGSSLASGVYIYRLKFAERIYSRKMLLIK